MKQHTIRRKTLAVIAAAAMMLANFALSNSALADTGRANPQSDVTVIAFQQSWNTIAQECQETYGPEGVGYVQISPPMESVQGTQWWTVYQPVSYDLNSRFGTREELSNMIKTCAASNVGVIADVVLNHTTGSDVSWWMTRKASPAPNTTAPMVVTRRWACITSPKAATTTSTAIRPAISMIAPKRSATTRTPTKCRTAD